MDFSINYDHPTLGELSVECTIDCDGSVYFDRDPWFSWSVFDGEGAEVHLAEAEDLVISKQLLDKYWDNKS